VTSEVDEWGQTWYSRLAPVQAAFQESSMPLGAFIAARDVNTGGSKMFTAFKSTQAFEEYTARMVADCQTPHLYEILLASEASWLYSDLDYTSRAEDPQDFLERRQHLHRLLEHFCTHIMQLPPGLLQPPEVAASHGALSHGLYKSSVHEVWKGLYFSDLEARTEFKTAFSHFLDHPPAELARSAEFIGYMKPDSGKRENIWDDSVYSRNRNWRTLRSSKLGSTRILCLDESSSERISDHLIGVRDEQELARAHKIDVRPLQRYNAAAGVGGISSRAAHGGINERQIPLRYSSKQHEPLERDLGPEERARLLSCCQQNHPGATLGRIEQLRPGLFSVHICSPSESRTCCIAGRTHTSEGNGQHLLYRRTQPAEAAYRCFSPNCQ
jgi:hypothetical protein